MLRRIVRITWGSGVVPVTTWGSGVVPVTTVGVPGVVDCAAAVPMGRTRAVNGTATLNMREMFLTMIGSLTPNGVAGKVEVRRLNFDE
jgi:hypothetical protein